MIMKPVCARWVLVGLLGATASFAGPADGGTPGPLRYLALGDSFTIGTGGPPDLSFPSQLKRLLLKRGLDVRLENMAVNGYSTNELIEEELAALGTFKPDTVSLAIGANDLVRGDDLDQYRRNLKLIFRAIRKAGVSGARVFVLPQPDWSQSPIADAFGDPRKLRARIEAYNEVLKEEALLVGAQYVDLFPAFVEQAKQKLVAPDGLHPNAKAYAAWAEALADRFATR